MAMSYAEKSLHAARNKLLLKQGGLVMAAAIAFFVFKGPIPAVAALFGGSIALLNTMVSAQRLRRATSVAGSDATRGMIELYIGAVTRFVATPALVAIGIVLLKLDPIAIIAGFGVAQLGYFIGNQSAPPSQPA